MITLRFQHDEIEQLLGILANAKPLYEEKAEKESPGAFKTWCEAYAESCQWFVDNITRQVQSR